MLKKLLLALIATTAVANSPMIWDSAEYGKMLTSLGFKLQDEKQYRTLTVNPSISGVTAAIGSVGLRNNAGVGEAWIKVGSGDTAWSQLSTSGSGTFVLKAGDTMSGGLAINGQLAPNLEQLRLQAPSGFSTGLRIDTAGPNDADQILFGVTGGVRASIFFDKTNGLNINNATSDTGISLNTSSTSRLGFSAIGGVTVAAPNNWPFVVRAGDTMTGNLGTQQVRLPFGTSPGSILYGDDTDTGPFQTGDGEYYIAANGFNRLHISQNYSEFLGPVTVTGDLNVGGNINFAAQNDNQVFAGPATGGPSTPTFRALVASDIPVIDISSGNTGTTGVLGMAQGGTGRNGYTDGAIPFKNPGVEEFTEDNAAFSFTASNRRLNISDLFINQIHDGTSTSPGAVGGQILGVTGAINSDVYRVQQSLSGTFNYVQGPSYLTQLNGVSTNLVIGRAMDVGVNSASQITLFKGDQVGPSFSIDSRVENAIFRSTTPALRGNIGNMTFDQVNASANPGELQEVTGSVYGRDTNLSGITSNTAIVGARYSVGNSVVTAPFVRPLAAAYEGPIQGVANAIHQPGNPNGVDQVNLFVANMLVSDTSSTSVIGLSTPMNLSVNANLTGTAFGFGATSTAYVGLLGITSGVTVESVGGNIAAIVNTLTSTGGTGGHAGRVFGYRPKGLIPGGGSNTFGDVAGFWFGSGDCSGVSPCYSLASEDANATVYSAGPLKLGLTPDTVPYLDGATTLVSSSVTGTELEYLSGVSLPIQSQIASLQGVTSGTFVRKSGDTMTGNLAAPRFLADDGSAGAPGLGFVGHASGLSVGTGTQLNIVHDGVQAISITTAIGISESRNVSFGGNPSTDPLLPFTVSRHQDSAAFIRISNSNNPGASAQACFSANTDFGHSTVCQQSTAGGGDMVITSNGSAGADMIQNVGNPNGILQVRISNAERFAVSTAGVSAPNLNANGAVYADANKRLQSLPTVDSTELGYLDGVTSAIQTQLNTNSGAIAANSAAITTSSSILQSQITSVSASVVANAAAITTSSSVLQAQINGKEPTQTKGTISSNTSQVVIGNGTNSTVGPNVTITVSTADLATTGLLTATDFATFNGVTSKVSKAGDTMTGALTVLAGATVTGGMAVGGSLAVGSTNPQAALDVNSNNTSGIIVRGSTSINTTPGPSGAVGSFQKNTTSGETAIVSYSSGGSNSIGLYVNSGGGAATRAVNITSASELQGVSASFTGNVVSSALLVGSLNIQTPAVSVDFTIGDSTMDQIMAPSATLATSTVRMPANPRDRMKVNFSCSGSNNITSLTMLPNTGQTLDNPLTACVAPAGRAWIYSSGTARWYYTQ